MKNKRLQIVVTLLLSVMALYIALRGVNFQQVSEALKQVDGVWIIITILLIGVTLIIRGQRWRILLGRKVSLRDSIGLINIGYLVSGVIPLRAGDPARAVASSLRGPVSALAALSMVVVERVLDMFLIVLILISTLPYVEELRDYLTTGQLSNTLSFEMILILSGVLTLGMLLTFLAIALLPDKVLQIAHAILDTVHLSNPDRWLNPLRKILDGLAVLRSPREGLAILLWSVALWIVTPLYFATTMQACRAFLPQGNFALKSIVATWASAFGMVFPATGGLGSFHFAVREALFWGFDIDRDLGVTYAVIVHAMPYLMGIVLGATTLFTWGISLKSLINDAQSVEDTNKL